LKIAILGSAPSYADAPYDDPDWTIWGLGGAPSWDNVKRLDAIFEMHKPRKWLYRAEYLNKPNVPVFMLEKYNEVPNSIEYPSSVVSMEIGREYFCSSIDYMLAYAIALKPEAIALYGIRMEHGTEYERQKPSCEYYLGLAEGRGIKVTISDDSSLLKPKWKYGYDDHDDMLAVLNAKQIAVEDDLAKQIAAIEKMRQDMDRLDGACKILGNLRKEITLGVNCASLQRI
jgi:hypothetical protein